MRACVALRKRDVTRLRRLVGGLAVALAVTLVAAVVAFVTREQAIRQEALATSRELAAGATAQLPIDPELAVLLAAGALRRAPTAEAEEALRAALLRSPVRATLRGDGGDVTALAYSSRGDLLVTAGGDGAARVWDATSGQGRATLRGHSGTLRSVAFSPTNESQQVLTGGDDGTARHLGRRLGAGAARPAGPQRARAAGRLQPGRAPGGHRQQRRHGHRLGRAGGAAEAAPGRARRASHRHCLQPHREADRHRLPRWDGPHLGRRDGAPAAPPSRTGRPPDGPGLQRHRSAAGHHRSRPDRAGVGHPLRGASRPVGGTHPGRDRGGL